MHAWQDEAWLACRDRGRVRTRGAGRGSSAGEANFLGRIRGRNDDHSFATSCAIISGPEGNDCSPLFQPAPPLTSANRTGYSPIFESRPAGPDGHGPRHPRTIAVRPASTTKRPLSTSGASGRVTKSTARKLTAIRSGLTSCRQ